MGMETATLLLTLRRILRSGQLELTVCIRFGRYLLTKLLVLFTILLNTSSQVSVKRKPNETPKMDLFRRFCTSNHSRTVPTNLCSGTLT
jgi:hypothetical protein